MINLEENIFSEDYDSSDETIMNDFENQIDEFSENNFINETKDIEQTNIENSNDYLISKPKRITIKAIIKNDKS